MIEPISATTVTLFLGGTAAAVIGSAAKEHAKGYVKRLLSKGEEKLLNKEELDALELAYETALTHGYTQTLEALGRVLELTEISFPEFIEYKTSVESFLKSEKVAEHLLETVRDSSDDHLPDPALLESEWQRLDGKSFPIPAVWSLVAVNFRKSSKEKALITPQLREVLNARNLDQIRAVQQKLLGVPVAVRQEQYVSRMRTKYAPVELANVAPA